MTDPVAPKEPGASTFPIWMGLGIGFVAAGPWWPYALLATFPLGAVIGTLIYLANRSSARWRASQGRNAELEARIEELERGMAAVERAMRERPTAEPQPTVVPVLTTRVPEASPDVRATPARSAETSIEPARAPSQVLTPPTIRTPESQPVLASEAVAPATAALAAPRVPPIAAAPATPPEPTAFERAIAAARQWLLGGNTVARVGVLILFVGIAFLLRYVAEHTRVPIEVRLLGVAVGALVFLGLGWRLRDKRPGFAITLQGAAIGILYLTAFAALRLYSVLPPLAAFGFMALLAALAAILAILQNARALASLGAAGGFIAPILISTGEGRVAMLFSYYLLLNGGVLAIAWFRAWRELNWIAFVATFGVSGLWAVRRYTPEDFLVGQGFLVAFWLLFLVVSLLYALRQTDRKRGLFDTTLVFTLPLAAFGIQTRFLEGVQLAIASTVAAAVYLAVSGWLVRRSDAAFQVLTEATFALGAGFLTLAIPLAASAQWTAAAWALEGVALLWVGQRQKRLVPIAAGVLLHVLGAFALMRAVLDGNVSAVAELSGFTVNLVVFAAAAFAASRLLATSPSPASQPLFTNLSWVARVVAWVWVVALVWQPLAFPWYPLAWCALAVALVAFDRRMGIAKLPSPEWVVGLVLIVVAAAAAELRFPHDGAQSLHLLLRLAVAVSATTAALLSLRSGDRTRRVIAGALLTLGIIAWLIAVIAEVATRVDQQLAVAQVALVVIGITSLALAWLGTQLAWEWPRRLAMAFFAAHVVLAGYVVADAIATATLPSKYYGWVAWPIAWILFYLRLGARDNTPERLPVSNALHVAGLWLFASMLAAEIALQLDRFAGDGWFHAAWGASFAGALWFAISDARRWPIRQAPFAYARIGAPGLAILAGAWLVIANIHSGGDPAPLPALPLFNPMDLASLATVGALFVWQLVEDDPQRRGVIRVAVAAAAFFVLNVIALRAVHFTSNVAWTATALGRSLIVQAVVSLLWTVTAMSLMLFAHRRGVRTVWVAGAVLLAAVVLKLFIVDLSAQGTIERIVSFVGVGLLILLIGYLAPVPPAAPTARAPEAS